MRKKIGIIGCGTIGRSLVERLVKDPSFELVSIVEPEKENVKGFEDYLCSSKEEMFSKEPELVVEAANPQVVIDFLPSVLKNANMAVFSLTAFSNDDFFQKAKELCTENNKKIFIPHGALVGIDALRGGEGILEKVEIITTKRPKNLGLDNKERKVAYSGSTREACNHFPRNVNVHAAIALAGLGFDKTISTIISDPDSPGNSHVIKIEGSGFQHIIEVLSKPTGLVTGAYTPNSAFHSLKDTLEKTNGLVFV